MIPRPGKNGKSTETAIVKELTLMFSGREPQNVRDDEKYLLGFPNKPNKTCNQHQPSKG